MKLKRTAMLKLQLKCTARKRGGELQTEAKHEVLEKKVRQLAMMQQRNKVVLAELKDALAAMQTDHMKAMAANGMKHAEAMQVGTEGDAKKGDKKEGEAATDATEKKDDLRG